MFKYPASWKLSNPEPSDNDHPLVDLKNGPRVDGLEGHIRVLAIRRDQVEGLKSRIDDLRTHFDETLNLEFEKMISTGRSDAYDRVTTEHYEVYDALSKKDKALVAQEVHLAVVANAKWYIFAFLLTPKETPGLNAWIWAQNVQSFQEVVKSVK